MKHSRQWQQLNLQFSISKLKASLFNYGNNIQYKIYKHLNWVHTAYWQPLEQKLKVITFYSTSSTGGGTILWCSSLADFHFFMEAHHVHIAYDVTVSSCYCHTDAGRLMHDMPLSPAYSVVSPASRLHIIKKQIKTYGSTKKRKNHLQPSVWTNHITQR